MNFTQFQQLQNEKIISLSFTPTQLKTQITPEERCLEYYILRLLFLEIFFFSGYKVKFQGCNFRKERQQKQKQKKTQQTSTVTINHPDHPTTRFQEPAPPILRPSIPSPTSLPPSSVSSSTSSPSSWRQP